jgi:hypothetical protein
MINNATKTKLKKINYNIKLAYSFLLKCITPFCLIIRPEFLSWLTHFNTPLRRLPSLKDRIAKANNPLDEFIFYTENLQKFEEVNVVMRGEYCEKINKNLPTFFININYPQKDFLNRYYVSSDRLKFKAMMGQPERKEDECLNYEDPEKKFFYFIAISPLIEKLDLNNPLLNFSSYIKKIKELKKILNFNLDYSLSVCLHKFNGYNIQVGSGILAVISLLHISKKVNVFGWDSFLSEKLSPSFFRQSLKLWSPFVDHQPVSRFAANVINWIYAHRLTNYFSTERLIVNGKMADIKYLEWVEKYLYKMIYK